MSLTRKLLDMGGGAIAGTLIAVTTTSEPMLVVVAMCASSVVAAAVPLIGTYSGIAAMIGLVVAIVLGLEGVSTWQTFVMSGFALGCVHLLILTLTRHATSAMKNLPTDLDARPVEMHNDHVFLAGWTYTKPGPMCVLLGSGVGIVVGLLVCGPAHVGSYFFCGCVVIGTLAGAALFLGLLASTVVTTSFRRFQTSRKFPDKHKRLSHKQTDGTEPPTGTQ